MSAVNMLLKCSVSSIRELHNNCNGGRSNEQDVGNKHESEPVPSTTKAHAAYKTIKLLFHAQEFACVMSKVFSP
jgi:hypothetical protein